MLEESEILYNLIKQTNKHNLDNEFFKLLETNDLHTLTF